MLNLGRCWYRSQRIAAARRYFGSLREAMLAAGVDGYAETSAEFRCKDVRRRNQDSLARQMKGVSDWGGNKQHLDKFVENQAAEMGESENSQIVILQPSEVARP